MNRPKPPLKCPKCGGDWLKRSGVTHYHGSRRGAQRYTCKACKWNGTRPIALSEATFAGVDRARSREIAQVVRRAARGRASAARRFVITAAQNATPVFVPFLAALLRYCERREATLLVIPYRYKNPTSIWSQQAQHDDWWAPDVLPYLCRERVNLHPYLTVLGDVHVQPTAKRPTNGLETITGPRSALIGHPKLELKSVATPQEQLPKLLATTGAVTRPNYIDSRAGKEGEFHHTYAAAVVELQGNAFHLRQLVAAPDGSFYDLDRHYAAAVEDVHPVAAAGLVMGDTHVDFIDPAVDRALFGPAGIVRTLRPRVLVWHDVLDFYSRSHHGRNDPVLNYVKHHAGRDDVRAEVERCFEFLRSRAPRGAKNIIVASNHPDALARWIKETDPRTDPRNTLFWAETYIAMCRGSRMGEGRAELLDPFSWWARKKLPRSFQILGPDASFTIEGVEVAMHGHLGPNGAPGSIGAFGRIGVRSVIGHSHTPGIQDGVYQVGTSSRLRLDYNRGPSSWLHTHCVIYPNGKRSLINVIDGKWRASP